MVLGRQGERRAGAKPILNELEPRLQAQLLRIFGNQLAKRTFL